MKRSVLVSDAVVAKAKQKYPPGGSADGTPSYALFSDTILAAARTQFSLGFDNLPEIVDGVPAIRHAITHAVPFFPATVFYGILDTDNVVTIVDFETDDDYFAVLDDDPTG